MTATPSAIAHITPYSNLNATIEALTNYNGSSSSPSIASTSSPADPLGGGAPAVGFASLTPDALMAYCQARLNSIDSQVQASFDNQEKNANQIAVIQDAANKFKENSSAAVTDPTVYQGMLDQLNTAIADITPADKSTPPSPALQKLQKTRDAMIASWNADQNLAATEVEGYAQDLTDAASDLNSSSELQMVQLQSLMSQRQTAISLTTNIVQSLGDQENKIADNIGK
jgi:hypothetical protein